MLAFGGHHVVHIGAEGQALRLAAPISRHLHGDEGRALDLDRHPLDRGHQEVSAVVLPAEHRGEELDEPRSKDRAPLVIPGAVVADLEPDIPAKINVWQCCRTRFAAGLLKCYENVSFVLVGHLFMPLLTRYLCSAREP